MRRIYMIGLEKTKESKTSPINKDRKKLIDNLTKIFQSCNINFLIGSGASAGAVQRPSVTEDQINKLFEDGETEKACQKLCEFLDPIQKSINPLLNFVQKQTNNDQNGNDDKKLVFSTKAQDWMRCLRKVAKFLIGKRAKTRQCIEDLYEKNIREYENFLQQVSRILLQRKSDILKRRANIFTTNYDLFFEVAGPDLSNTFFNDGFQRSPSLHNKFKFNAGNFMHSLKKTGSWYSYDVEVPCLNLIKLHGSFSWEKTDQDEIIFRDFRKDPFKKLMVKDATDTSRKANDERLSYINQFSLILPKAKKYAETVLDRTYYTLLRHYANELDRENSVLIVFGFSFDDQHILDITKRALRNPTLQLVIFSYTKNFKNTFPEYSNVTIIEPESNDYPIDFSRLNDLLAEIAPDNISKSDKGNKQ